MFIICLEWLNKTRETYSEIYDCLQVVELNYDCIKAILKRFNWAPIFYSISLMFNIFYSGQCIKILNYKHSTEYYRKYDTNFEKNEFNFGTIRIEVAKYSGVLLGDIFAPILNKYKKNPYKIIRFLFIANVLVFSLGICLNKIFVYKKGFYIIEIFQVVFVLYIGFIESFCSFYAFKNVFQGRITRHEKEIAILILRSFKFFTVTYEGYFLDWLTFYIW